MRRISAPTLPRKDSVWAYNFEKASGWDRFAPISRAAYRRSLDGCGAIRRIFAEMRFSCWNAEV
jgi:hypothetical protein